MEIAGFVLFHPNVTIENKEIPHFTMHQKLED